MDCLRCDHRLPPEEEKRGRKWHNECPKVCTDQWCSNVAHDTSPAPLVAAKPALPTVN